jgi:hypothetical protein
LTLIILVDCVFAVVFHRRVKQPCPVRDHGGAGTRAVSLIRPIILAQSCVPLRILSSVHSVGFPFYDFLYKRRF